MLDQNSYNHMDKNTLAHFVAKQIPAIEALFQAILSLENLEDCEAFFKDLCTRQELIALSQRL